MSISHLTLIGERINPGFATSKALLDREDLAGLQALALSQKEKGAEYLTINVGEKATSNPGFLIRLIEAVQEVVDLPLAFDYPHPGIQELCLGTYNAAKAHGRKPIVNSVSELRLEMLDLLKIRPVKLVIMASERLQDGHALPNLTAQDVAATARLMIERILATGNGMTLDDVLIDVSLSSLATDTEGQTRRAIEAIRTIGSDPDLQGVHLMVGLSNLGVMLPKLALDGSRLGVKLECAFLTLAVPLGLDTILGTPGRDYRILPDDDFVLQGFREAIQLKGYDALLRLRQLYRKA
jgi:cobalamin-dependent methionine synthase I